MRSIIFALLATALLGTTVPAATLNVPHVRVDFDGISEKQARAIAETLSAAREVYVTQFAADMPETIQCTVRCGPKETTRLFNDGNDRVSLSVTSADKLAKPSKSGTFLLYGLCHEAGHLAMYRTLKDRDWMTNAAAEGWAHFAGSVVVDAVYEAKGEKLWPDTYDYRQDGTARLDRQLADKSADETTRAAGYWRQLDGIVGRKNLVPLFAAWQGAKVDPAAPDDALLTTLRKTNPDKSAAIDKWWSAAKPLLVESRPASGFKKVEIPVAKLSGKPLAIADDDGTSEGRKSIAGGGHARAFKTPAGAAQWYLRSVSIYGSRYGQNATPKTDFEVALCDSDMRPIATWKQPYSRFARGDMKWVKLDMPPILVPEKFQICVQFRPTASSGVFVGIDESTSGSSHVATPGKPGDALPRGDWLIRVELDQLRTRPTR